MKGVSHCRQEQQFFDFEIVKFDHAVARLADAFDSGDGAFAV
jgi:hypothetical protein